MNSLEEALRAIADVAPAEDGTGLVYAASFYVHSKKGTKEIWIS